MTNNLDDLIAWARREWCESAIQRIGGNDGEVTIDLPPRQPCPHEVAEVLLDLLQRLTYPPDPYGNVVCRLCHGDNPECHVTAAIAVIREALKK